MITLKIVLRKRKLKDGSFPVMLRITKDGVNKLINLDMRAKEGDFADQEFKSSYKNFRKRNNILSKYKLKANIIIDEYFEADKDFTLKDFAEKFLGKDSKKISVWEFFDLKVNGLFRSGKIGSAEAYLQTKNAMLLFHPGVLWFKDITPQFLENFEIYMRERGNQEGGMAFKYRQLRALYNDAVNKEVISELNNPFKKYKISKLKAREHKRALTIEELRAFKNVNFEENPLLINAYNYFMFSFYTRGMNFKDQMLLRWENIQGHKLIYTRSKTRKKFAIELLPPVMEILNHYQERKLISPFVFPILLKEGLTPRQFSDRKHKVLYRYNKQLGQIAELANIKKKLTSYVARHSYATIMKFQGASTDIISESLGHSNLLVTMNYLKEFENSVIDKEHHKLMELSRPVDPENHIFIKDKYTIDEMANILKLENNGPKQILELLRDRGVLDTKNQPLDVYFRGGIFIYTDSRDILFTKMGANFIKHLLSSNW